MYQAFLGNMGTGRADVKGEIQAVGAVRMRVPMQRTGAEQPVVVLWLNKSVHLDGINFPMK
jgi:hypothetical protein